MFSANENIMLREHKKRIVGFVEDCIPDDVKDAGTMVMVMQLTCQAPGCVPLETAVIVIFPPSDYELLPGLPQSGGTSNNNNNNNNDSSKSGNFQTKILKPMAEVTRDDVLDALPPAFTGGRRSMEKLCIRARDVMLAQITQIMGDNNDEDEGGGRKLMAEYLIQCLQEYMQHNFVPPEYGEPYPPSRDDATVDRSMMEIASDESMSTTQEMATTTMTAIPGTGNLVIRRTLGNHDVITTNSNTVMTAESTAAAASIRTNTTLTLSNGSPTVASTTIVSPPTTIAAAAAATPSQMDWRNRQRQQGLLSNASMGSSSSSNSIMARLAEREHAPGVRRPGCPCCDPDNISNILDKMMNM